MQKREKNQIKLKLEYLTYVNGKTQNKNYM